MNQYFAGLFDQSTALACISDLTPPTFAGVTTVTPNLNGSLTVEWNAATDDTLPIEYLVFIQKSTATGLFNNSNLAMITENLSAVLFTLADNSLLEKNAVYYVGVRAKDAVGNIETNLVSAFATSYGVLDDDLASIAQKLLAIGGTPVTKFFALSKSPGKSVAFESGKKSIVTFKD